MTAGISEETTAFTQSDRELLTEIRDVLREIEPYLPLLARAAKLMDNPATRWKARHGHVQP